jgi:hypothetical protein
MDWTTMRRLLGDMQDLVRERARTAPGTLEFELVQQRIAHVRAAICGAERCTAA